MKAMMADEQLHRILSNRAVINHAVTAGCAISVEELEFNDAPISCLKSTRTLQKATTKSKGITLVHNASLLLILIELLLIIMNSW